MLCSRKGSHLDSWLFTLFLYGMWLMTLDPLICMIQGEGKACGWWTQRRMNRQMNCSRCWWKPGKIPPVPDRHVREKELGIPTANHVSKWAVFRFPVFGGPHTPPFGVRFFIPYTNSEIAFRLLFSHSVLGVVLPSCSISGVVYLHASSNILYAFASSHLCCLFISNFFKLSDQMYLELESFIMMSMTKVYCFVVN